MQNTSGITISVRDDPGRCPCCGGPWHVQKTTFHHGKTISHGQFEIRETIHVCAVRCRDDSGDLVTRRAISLAEHIIPDRVVGYDVVVFIGLQRFIYHRQREEIRSALFQEHGISLSTGQISNLSKLFLQYIKRLHNKHAKQLQSMSAKDGGWPLHIDATGEDGRGTLLVALDGWRKWVLGAWKIPTERTDAILPCLRDIVEQFGAPCAIMRDLGRAITPAVNELLVELDLDITVLACHLHFLKDIGNDLLKPSHEELRRLFRKTKIRPKLRTLVRELGRSLGGEVNQAREEVRLWQEQTGADLKFPKGRAGIGSIRALTQWILDYSADSTGQDFPFDRPYLDLYNRCMTADKAIDTFISIHQTDPKVLKILKRLQRILHPVGSDVPFRQIVKRLSARSKLFDELRHTLRLAPNTGSAIKTPKNRYSTEQTDTDLQDIRNELDQLVTSLRERRPKRGPAKDSRDAIDLILRHIEDHGDYLWGHAITLPPGAGGGIRLVARTNNILESFFHETL